eukprot:TRINITY_DN7276_c0_g1_i1.p1 TRINITY_DN7276_c0_g1~~TRINITY_DN7276_c0_g1_i1.p1  ORF type:complete len:333 (+),score=119.05 TRINITY_DN7276_c0_g1_i1:285-1283(+)
MDKWLHTLSTAAHQEAPFKLVVFPYAGGNPNEFNVTALTSVKADLMVVNYPGRGRRRGEDNVTECKVLADEVAKAMQGVDQPYAFVGYSMGGLVAYETAKEIRRMGKEGPACLFIVADEAPQTQKAFVRTDVSDEEFLSELQKLDLISSDILSNREMVDAILPPMKADMAVENNYVWEEAPDSALPCPIIGICGSDDKWVDKAKMAAWGKLTPTYTYYEIPNAPHIFLADKAHAFALRSLIIKHCTAPYLPLIKDFPKGQAEPIQIMRIEQSHPVKLLGNTWVKWDAQTNKPLPKPAVLAAGKPPGLGAYYTDVKQMLIIRGYEGVLQETWG